MATDTTVPVQIESEAAERLAQLGLQREFEQMLEHARQTIPHIRRIEVTSPPRYDNGGDPLVYLEVYVTQPESSEERLRLNYDYDHWVFRTFLPEVHEHFPLAIYHETPDGR
jgi:hypothetical protein